MITDNGLDTKVKSGIIGIENNKHYKLNTMCMTVTEAFSALFTLDLIYTNIYANGYANGHATMKLGNIRTGMRFDKNFPVVISRMRMSCDCRESPTRLPCNLPHTLYTNSILKTPLRLPYGIICGCPAIATR